MKKLFAALIFAMMCGFSSVASANGAVIIMMGAAVNNTNASSTPSSVAKEAKLNAEVRELTAIEKEEMKTTKKMMLWVLAASLLFMVAYSVWVIKNS